MYNARTLVNLLMGIREKITPSLSVYCELNLSDCTSVLDLGCGKNSPISRILLDCNGLQLHSVGVDIFKLALLESKNRKIHSDYILGDLTKIEFKDKSFDAVVCLALLEHLPKEDGLCLVKKMEKWAKKILIIAVPNGYQYQDAYDGNSHQIHRSDWNTKDFKEMGFKVHGLHGYRTFRGELGLIKYRPTLFWLMLSDLTQKLVYNLPKYASTLFAVKEIYPKLDK